MTVILSGQRTEPGSSELHPAQGRLLGVLTLAAVERLGGAALLVDADNHLRELKIVRVNDVVLIDQPADDAGPRCINCYLVEDEKAFKFDPRLLYSLQWLHKATPPDLIVRPSALAVIA